jgi:hypothetical protein
MTPLLNGGPLYGHSWVNCPLSLRIARRAFFWLLRGKRQQILLGARAANRAP